MNQQPQFYKKVVPLNQEHHGAWRLDSGVGYRFARNVNAVTLRSVEFAHACHEYPIVFVEHGGVVIPVAVLGFKDNQNLFVADDGSWKAEYIPSYVRRYPFILANNEVANKEGDPTYTVCIDEDFSGFNQDKGEKLFIDNGEQSPFLKQSIELLKGFNHHHEQTEKFANKLKEWGLLDSLQANVEMNSGEKMSLTGFMAVQTDRLKQLDPGKMTELVKMDEMGLVYYHLHSLNNFALIVNRQAAVAKAVNG